MYCLSVSSIAVCFACLTSSVPNLGLWKSSAESTQGFSFSGLQRTQELYPSSPNPIFSTSLNVGFSTKNEPSALSNKHFYWPMRETRADSYSASISKVPSEKKQEPSSAGCRLFGIEISSAVEATSPLAAVSGVGQDQPAASVDAESDQLSQPSHANKSDAPAASSEPSPHETQSRQVRSCTKVMRVIFACNTQYPLVDSGVINNWSSCRSSCKEWQLEGQWTWQGSMDMMIFTAS